MYGTEKHIALDGATGFLGRNILGDFLKDGHVERLYLLSRNPKKWPANLEKWRNHPKITLVEADIEDPQVIKDPKRRRDLQHIITEFHHLTASTKFHERERDETFKMNYDGTRNVLRFVQGARRLKRFVHVSTLYVNNVLQSPIAYEDKFPPQVGLVEPYHESKYLAEKAVRGSGLPWTILRPGVFSGDSFDGDSGLDSRTGYGITLGILHAALKAHPELGGTSKEATERVLHYLDWRKKNKNIHPEEFFDVDFRLDGYDHATKNVMSMDDIANQTKAIIGSEIDTIGKTYHIANNNPLTARQWIDSICYALRFKGVKFGGSLKLEEWQLGKMPDDPKRPWTKEEKLRRNRAETMADGLFNQHYSRGYFVRPDAIYDTTNTDSAIRAYNERFPDDQLAKVPMTVPLCSNIMDQWVENELHLVNDKMIKERETRKENALAGRR
ncbi:MAG TPA: SDR family oxidoreductase [Candidatus Nanoarchaeia archaeon]|nr:SDR family oxidoreductase [Candidatus Nanoarchaeia archaeon]